MAISEDDAPSLIDGTAPSTPDDLFRRLDELGIHYTTHSHQPVFTVEEARVMRGDVPGSHTKNLFVRDKKKRMWLLVCEQESDVRLRAVEEIIGSKRLSFGSPERLMHYLGVIPGAVNPFAIMNDRSGAVQVVLDRAIFAKDPVNFHPLVNSMTTAITKDDFLRFLTAERHEPLIIDLP
jgi:Ala-tRNA(Pro) deacylase